MLRRRGFRIVMLVAALAPLAAYGVLYTWNPDVETGKWQDDNWLFTCPPTQTCADYPDDDNDDALIVVGNNSVYERTVELGDDCIDEFTYDGYDSSTEGLLTLTFVSDGSGPKTVTCSMVTLDGHGQSSDQTTQFVVDDGAELTTIGTCE